ncbi:capsular polysaccharide biosynthesis protein (DUF2972 domain) [Campylobacter upsaliensis RM3940]|uniref:DUF2972 domain-containing protein n=2 Tax=Campylobacter upsaliensis TaxID=28080 RepID=UPI001593DC0D|nr:DUF2972 domain-containing protein [Campylobacter upsaliensis]EAJ4635324.1 DUF2972 domain-containing protein [Campylobacter upsaliensis]QKF87682.1 capsular polysaccharide biosynthesis protein (DUF2972 domain) [Campylobacter upsaliensis RM3940]
MLECDRDKLKGGYFKFFSKIKQAKKEFKALKESKVYRLKDKFKFKNEEDFDLFIKNYALIENLLTHYEALNEVIVLNMAFVLEHFDEVSLWLNSREFKEKYEDINHPYPPLLNPDKLNDENYILNYEKISANLAWEMNLPLPRRYEFAYTLMHGAGGSSFYWFMKSLKVECANSWVGDDKAYYKENYKALTQLKNDFFIWIIHYAFFHYKKSLQLLSSNFPLLILVRDPISVFKHLINHQSGSSRKKNVFDLNDDYALLIPDILYTSTSYENEKYKGEKSIAPNLENLHLHSGTMVFDNVRKTIAHKEVFYIDMQEIMPQNAFKTFTNLAKKFNFTPPNPKEKDFYKIMHNTGGLVAILDFKVMLDKEISIFVDSAKTRRYLNQNFMNINEEILGLDPENFKLCIEKRHYDLLLEKNELYEKTKHYLKGLYEYYLKRVEIEKKKLLNEKQILEYFKNNKTLALKFKKAFDIELEHIKTHRPDIVASWKYYKEFEKMCEELGSAERD